MDKIEELEEFLNKQANEILKLKEQMTRMQSNFDTLESEMYRLMSGEED
jgi:uncharacterized coiled-coil protein SlyX